MKRGQKPITFGQVLKICFSDIAHLDKAELEHCTLESSFGLCNSLWIHKEVNKIMKLHNIQLENETMNLYVSCGLDKQFHTSCCTLSNTLRSQIQQVHYSVSSGSGTLEEVFQAVEVVVASVPSKNSTQPLKV